MSNAFIQTLEDRKLFAAQPMSLTPGSVVNPHLQPSTTLMPASKETEQPVKKAGKQKAAAGDEPLVRATDLTGEWDGHVKVRYGFFSKKYDFELSIYHQTDHSISGRLEIDDHDFEGTFFGRINPKNGRFRFEMDDDDEEVTIKGQLSKRGIIIGGGKVEAEYWGWDIKGSFELDRLA